MIEKFKKGGSSPKTVQKLNQIVAAVNAQLFDGRTGAKLPSPYSGRYQICVGKSDTVGSVSFTGTFLDANGDKVTEANPSDPNSYYRQTIWGSIDAVDAVFVAIREPITQKWYSITGGSGGSSGSILFGTVTQGLEYATETSAGVSTYTVDIVDPDNPSADTTAAHPLIFNQSTHSGGEDYRNYIPWMEEGKTVPILSYGGEYYFLNEFTFVGNPTAKSLSWNESEGRAMAVFR